MAATEARTVQALRFYKKGQIQLEQVPTLYVAEIRDIKQSLLTH